MADPARAPALRVKREREGGDEAGEPERAGSPAPPHAEADYLSDDGEEDGDGEEDSEGEEDGEGDGLPDEPFLLPPESLNDLQLEAAAQQGRVLMVSVEEARLTRHLCRTFIARNGSNMRFVPARERSACFDREAVMLDAWAFGYLNEGDK